MKLKLHYWLLTLVLALAGTTVSVAQSEVYGVINSGADAGLYKYTISSQGVDNVEFVQNLNLDDGTISGGYLLGTKYYYSVYRATYSGHQSVGIYCYDIEEKTSTQILDWGGQSQGPTCASWCYDYQTQTMYTGNGVQGGGSQLQTVDLETGALNTVADISLDQETPWASSSQNTLSAMAMTYDGVMYGVSYWGGLYTVNLQTGACTYVGPLSDACPDPNTGVVAFQYTGACDLVYDNNTGKMYLFMYQYPAGLSPYAPDGYGGIGSGYALFEVNPKTAEVTYLQDTENKHFTGNTIPFSIAEASAPAKAENVTVTAGQGGALSATVEWDNPSKTYGRGGTLEELDSMVIFRDGQWMARIDNPVIGGHESWTDNTIAERGYYSYLVVGYNSMGAGDRASDGAYVGPGDPLAVTDVVLEADGVDGKLTWTAPTNGKYNSWIDTDDLTYEITRYPDGTLVGSGIEGTTFTDTTLPNLGKYYYGIVAMTGGHASPETKSETVMLGPAFSAPAHLGFDTQDEYNLWTAYNETGGWAYWRWQNGYGYSMTGACITYGWDNLSANNLLVSPYINFEAGKHYKLTFDAVFNSASVPEVLAITFSPKNEMSADLDSVTQFVILPKTSSEAHSLRANLPVVDESGNYYLGFYYRSPYSGGSYGVTIGNVMFEEDHDGYISGKVTDADGNPIAGALLLINGGQYNAATDANGEYTLSYLPAGDYNIEVSALGYYSQTVSASVAELETTALDVTLQALPVYTVSGTVKDVAGDPVEGAAVTISGYNTYTTQTAADGTFSIEDVYESNYYSVNLVKNKLMDFNKSFTVEGDIDLGELVMQDNIKAPREVKAAEAQDKQTVDVEWAAPANDPAWVRYDDGQATTYVGIEGAGSNAVFGIVDRNPSTVFGTQFYIGSVTQVMTHYSVGLRIFDLDENGEPTSNLLYENTYVPVTDNQWTTYTLPAPVDAPNGYYIAISHYTFAALGIDGAGDTEKYPFVEHVNCFTSDYTSGNFFYIDGQSDNLRHNFLMRAYSAPYTVPEDADVAALPKFRFNTNNEKGMDLTAYKATGETPEPVEAISSRTVQQRVRYNLYRFRTEDLYTEDNWTLLAEKTAGRSYTDTDWAGLEAGSYYYGVKAVYTGDINSDMTMADSIGNKMSAKVTFRLTTNTVENEAYGAQVFMITGGGRHVYQQVADEDGIVQFDDVWKAAYDVTISLDGFISHSQSYDLTSGDEFAFDVQLVEDQKQPTGLIIETTDIGTSRNFIWNFPDYFYDGFEGHPDFMVNSPGSIGWQYIDGDGMETGGMYYYTWENQFAPMAYMVWNPRATEPDMYNDNWSMHANSGDKCLTDWAAYGAPNDDWLITPKLHFQQDFKYRFYAKSSDYNYLETFSVGYSTTDAEPESFTWVAEDVTAWSYYTQFSYDIPKEATYVALRCTSDEKRIFFVDDVEFGLPEAMANGSAYFAPRKVAKAPALEGAYEVYLDGVKVADTDDTEYLLENLTVGTHTAGVLASYTSGKTEMSTIDFEVTGADGISLAAAGKFSMAIDGRRLTISGDYDNVAVYALDGTIQGTRRIASGVYSLNSLPAGAYVVNVTANGKTNAMKVTLK